MTIPAKLQKVFNSALLPGLLLSLAVSLLYGGFLWNPVIFDDAYFFDGKIPQIYGHSVFHFDLRWFAYASLGWTANLFGQYLIGFRLGNLALHAATAIVLFLFLRCLFDVALPSENAVAQAVPRGGLSHTWLAFFGALLFAVHPVAVYAPGYLTERSIVMATLFSLLSWRTYLEGLLRGQQRWFFVAAGFYFLAVFSKEQAVMAPAVALALTLLLHPPSRELFKKIALPFALFALIGALVTLKAKGVLGSPYEPFALDMLKQMSESQGLPENIAYPYPLSVATQCFLFFKYVLLWLLPNPAWMSVDMREPFAVSLLAWPYVLGGPCFVLYGAVSLWLLLQRGKRGVLGFAMLFPWLLFVTELSTVRIQEPFVLYRSYLWMGGTFAVLPVLLGNIPARRAVVYLLGASLLIVPLAWNRLTTFSHPLLLWDDAASLIQDRPYLPGFERIYYNRGIAFYGVNLKQKALEDYSRVIAEKPDYSYAYNNRGEIYFDFGRYQEALLDLNKSIELKPDNANPYLGRGLVFEALHNIPAARTDFQKSCELGMQSGCERLRKVGGA
jgi:hypothetical protein